MKRYCVVTHQRTGSTLCLRLLADYLSSENNLCLDLGEIFEPFPSKVLIAYEKELFAAVTVTDEQHDFDIFITTHNITMLKTLEDTKPFVVKLFGFNYLDNNKKQHIINLLKDMNTEFIWLKRDNLEHIFMSHLLSTYQNKWSDEEYDIVDIDIEQAKIMFDDTKNMYLNTMCFVKEISKTINLHTVTYETMKQDLSQILGTTINFTDESKQAKKDYYQYLTNGAEVKELLHRYLEEHKDILYA